MSFTLPFFFFFTPNSQRNKSASEQRKECRDLAPSLTLEPNHLHYSFLPTLGAQPSPSSPGHRISTFLAFLEVTGGLKKCESSAEQDSGSPRSDAPGSCKRKGRPKLWVVLREIRETVSQAFSHSGTLIASLESYVWNSSEEPPIQSQGNFYTKLCPPITAEGKPCSVLLTKEPSHMCSPESSQGLLRSRACK